MQYERSYHLCADHVIRDAGSYDLVRDLRASVIRCCDKIVKINSKTAVINR